MMESLLKFSVESDIVETHPQDQIEKSINAKSKCIEDSLTIITKNARNLFFFSFNFTILAQI